ncbi:chaperonin [Mortierella sp. GBA43]|nr:chaperonin [Mortierella sp. GBA43]
MLSITRALKAKAPVARQAAASWAMPTRLSNTRMYSSHKEISFGIEGRAKLLKGVEVLAKAVAVTLGPKGRHVLIGQPYGSPKITKDGVTVAKSITLEDPFENLGAKLIQDVANKTNETAGDGTTTATVLTRAIFAEGVKNVAAGCNPMDLRKGVQMAVDVIVEFLRQNKREITTTQEIAQVGTISANGDKAIGNLLAQAMEKVGKEGVITVKDGKTTEDELEITEGMRFDRGYISPYFVTDTKTQKVEFEKPLILLSEKKISVLQDVLPALEAAATQRRPLLIIAEDIDGEALAAAILNKLRGQLQVAAVKAPGFGDNRKSILGDLATLTGGVVFSDELDVKLERLTPDLLGTIGSITITKEDTILNGTGAGSTEAIAQRCEQLRALIADPSTSDYEREKLEERLARLSSGVAIIRVGGQSEVEVGEKKDRIVDALNATKCAVDSGVLPGGGTALLKSLKVLDSLKGENFDQQLGINIVRSAIQVPSKTIISNAGGEGAVVIAKVVENGDFHYGYDAATGDYGDMYSRGVLDPFKVVVTGLKDAAGVASLLSTSEAMIVDAPSKDKSPLGGMGGMGGMINEAARIIAQLLVAGTQIVGKAFMEAYRQAAANAAKNGGQHAAKSGGGGSKAAAGDAITRKTGMSLDEAMNILNITKDADLAKVVKNYQHLYKVNDKSVNGSFYLQSKVVRAKERLEMEWASQGNPMKIEDAPSPESADSTTSKSSETGDSKSTSSTSSNPPN